MNGEKSSETKRILLKLSGESIMGDKFFGIDHQSCQKVAVILQALQCHGMETGVVIGGGNILRGQSSCEFGFERIPADHIGMLATCINGLALCQALSQLGEKKVRVVSARNFDGIIEPYNWQQTNFYLAKGVIVIFVGGSGNPFFTTDTSAALRASEINAKLLIKATKVDGIYNKDPGKFRDAQKFDFLSYDEALHLDLPCMDGTAISLCRSNNIDILFTALSKESILSAAINEEGGTLVSKNSCRNKQQRHKKGEK